MSVLVFLSSIEHVRQNIAHGVYERICLRETLMRTISSGMFIMAPVSQFSKLLAQLRMACVKAPVKDERDNVTDRAVCGCVDVCKWHWVLV